MLEYTDKVAINKNNSKSYYVFALMDKGDTTPNIYRYEAIFYDFAKEQIWYTGGSKTKFFRNFKYIEPNSEDKKEAMGFLFNMIFKTDKTDSDIYNLESYLRFHGVKNWNIMK